MQTSGPSTRSRRLELLRVSYKEIAAWCSVVERLAGFERTLERVRAETAIAGVRRADGDDTKLIVKDVDLHLPDGKPLMANVNLSFCGETACFWVAPPVRGRARSSVPSPESGRSVAARSACRRRPGSSFFRSDRYLPVARSASVVSYPMAAAGWTTRRCVRRSRRWGLELAGRLDEAGHWRSSSPPASSSASPSCGCRKPDWLFPTRRPRRWPRPRGAPLSVVRERSRGRRVQRAIGLPCAHPRRRRRGAAREQRSASVVEVTARPIGPR